MRPVEAGGQRQGLSSPRPAPRSALRYPLPRGRSQASALGTSAMTLMEVDRPPMPGNLPPMISRSNPTPFAPWRTKLVGWLTTRKDSFSRGTHEGYRDDAAAQRSTAGTGRNAVLPIANYGKTGTTQDYRDRAVCRLAGEIWWWAYGSVMTTTPPMKGHHRAAARPRESGAIFLRGAVLKPKPPTEAESPTGPSPDPSQGPGFQPPDIEKARIPWARPGTEASGIDGGGVTLSQEGRGRRGQAGRGGLAVVPAPAAFWTVACPRRPR